MKNNLLRLPHGTETLYLEETYRHRKILRHMEDLTESWGYLPVQTPVFDFYDNYRPLLDSKLEDQTYRMIDREGDLLMLRSDITLFLARQMGLTLTEEELPVRVFYSDSILRHQDHEDIASHEFFQTGCELIGLPGTEGDLEIIFLLAETLKEFKLPPSRIHIGSTPLFQAIARPFSEEDARQLTGYVHTREKQSIRKLLQSVYRKEVAEELTDLLLFIGTGDEFADRLTEWESLLDGLLKEPLGYLKQISLGWKDLNEFEDMFRIDLSETGDQPYYSGLVFNAYTEGCGTAIASGGRYDGLLDNFGYSGEQPAFSVGFSLFLRKLEKLSGVKTVPPVPHSAASEESVSAADRYRRATEMRKDGRTVIL